MGSPIPNPEMQYTTSISGASVIMQFLVLQHLILCELTGKPLAEFAKPAWVIACACATSRVFPCVGAMHAAAYAVVVASYLPKEYRGVDA